MASGSACRDMGARHDDVPTLPIEAFDPAHVRPWVYHNRSVSGLDDASLDDLANSIRRDGQQQLGLARRLPDGDTHQVEAIFGVRRLEACRRAGAPWRAQVQAADFPDERCAALMHSENEWTMGVSPLENAVQWKAMLEAGVFSTQQALANALGVHRATVSRAVRGAEALLGEAWLRRLVEPVLREINVRTMHRMTDALAETGRAALARERASALRPGTLSGSSLYNALFGSTGPSGRETLYVDHATDSGRRVVRARVERRPNGGWLVDVRTPQTSADEMAMLAEHVEALLNRYAASASSVRLGRKLVEMLRPHEAQAAHREWLEGCVWTAARASGLTWDRWRCAAAAEVLRAQPEGWERAVVAAIGTADGE